MLSFLGSFIIINNLSLDSILAKREMSQLLLLTNSLQGLFIRSQSSTHSTGLLDTEIQRNVLLLLVEETELFTLGLVDDSQDTSNVLTGFTAAYTRVSYSNIIYTLYLQFLSSTTGNLLNTEVSKSLLLFVKDLEKLSLVLVTEFVCFNGSLENVYC